MSRPTVLLLNDNMDNRDPENPIDRQADSMTRLLDEVAQGREGALSELFPLVYAELRSIAGKHMAAERPDHTLEPTALVHEAYVRLVGGSNVQWQNRAQFFYTAAEAMRRILIEHARGKGRIKRGQGRKRDLQQLEGLADLAENSDLDEILAVDDAVRRLETQNPEVGSVVRLRFYAGLSFEETASTTGLSPRQVYRHWAYARAWLFRELKSKS
jgi:RNA polymerase sigma factor (TIGR02999 family)